MKSVGYGHPSRRISARDGIIALVLGLALVPHSAAEPIAGKPNVILILADDLGYGDVAANNPHARTRTPHLDRLHREGIRFTEAHAGYAACIPSRYGLLTGRYFFRKGYDGDYGAALGGAGYMPPLIEAGRPTLGSLMQKAGYATACIGKWHLGMNWESNDPAKPKGLLGPDTRYTNTNFGRGTTDGPNSRGFDYSFILPSSASDPPFVLIRNGRVLDPDVSLITDRYPSRLPGTQYEWDRKYVAAEGDVYRARGVIWKNGEISRSYRLEEVADRVLAEGVGYIEEHVRTKNPRPFFMYLALSAPHTPWLPNERFRGTTGLGTYGDHVAQMDAAVGEVRATLERLGIAGNTLVIFTSDNGAHWGEEDVQQYGHQSAWGRRGQKGDIWDGGHRVPFVAYWPGAIRKPAAHGQAISLNDVFATLAEMTAQPLGTTEAEDSFSFLPVLRGAVDQPTRGSIIYHSGGGLAIMKDGWKYISFLGSGGMTEPRSLRPVGGPAGQLYHVTDDPLERLNLWFEEPAKVAELSALLAKQVAQGFTAPR